MSHPSDDLSNAADIDEERSAVGSNHETDEKKFEPDDETKSYKWDESEIKEYSCHVSSTGEHPGMHDNRDVSRHSDAEDEELLIQQTSTCTYCEWFGFKSVYENKEEHNAAKRGRREDVRSLLMSSANVDVRDSMDNTPLHYASLNGHIDVVNLLLSKNATVNSKNSRDWTPLHLASRHGHFVIAQILLKNNADVHVTNRSNNTPIDIANKYGHCELVQLLINSIEFSQKETLSLYYSAKCGNAIDVQQLLLNCDSNPNAMNLYGDTPLHLSSENGHLEVVEVLLRNKADANIRNASYKIPLHISSELGYVEIVKSMIDHGGKVDAIDGNSDAPLHLASENGHLEVVDVLLRNNANANVRNASGKTSLHISAELDYAEIVKSLIDCSGEVNAIDRNVDTPLHLASENGHFEVVKILLKNNAVVNFRNASFKTSIHIAAELDYAEIVKSLIDHRGEVNMSDRNGDTALHLAANNGHISVVNVLLSQTAEMDSKVVSQLGVNQDPANKFELSQNPIKKIKTTDETDQTTNQMEVAGGNAEIPNLQLSQSPIGNSVFRGQATPLQISAEHGHAEILEKLIFNGANVNACNNAKRTPLHLACKNGHISIVEILLINHAVVDVVKQSKETPFYLAAENGHAEVTDLLLRRGVGDFVFFQGNFLTPLHLAVSYGHTKVIEVIVEHSRKISEKQPKDENRPKENSNNFVEVRGVVPAEFVKGDFRIVSGEIVWREENTPIEIRRCPKGIALDCAVSSVNPEMVRLLLSGDQSAYSEEVLRKSFGSLMAAIECKIGLDVFSIQYMKNVREIAEALINTSKFNVNNIRRNKYTLLHEMIGRCKCSSDAIPELLKMKTSQIYTNVLSNRVGLPHHIQKSMSNSSWSEWRRRQVQIRNDLIELLLDKGADFNLKNSYGKTPLINASEKGCCHAIKILFDWEQKSGGKLDLDARDRFGATALIRAAEKHHVSVVRMLINHKASVNLHNYYGLTALHSSIYEPNYYWFDFHFFCNLLRLRNNQGDFDFEMSRDEEITWEGKSGFDPNAAIDEIQDYLEYDEQNSRIKEEVVKLLLSDDKTNVHNEGSGGNTSLDLAMKFSKRIAFTSATLETLRNRDTIRSIIGSDDEAPVEVEMVDERGRNPLHRLIISFNFQFLKLDGIEIAKNEKRFNAMVYGIILRPGNFIELAAARDNKGRTPLHYAIMPPSKPDALLEVLLMLGSNVNAADIYGKTPLHYAEWRDQYKFLVRAGADEKAKDINGYTPKDLKQQRDFVTTNKSKSIKLIRGGNLQKVYLGTTQVFNANLVTGLSKQIVVETIRIRSQSRRFQESPEEAALKEWTDNQFCRRNGLLGQLKPYIPHSLRQQESPTKLIWRIWAENAFFNLNRRLGQLKPYIQHFVDRLAYGIKENDSRFECQPTLVGSAEEETKSGISGDFDVNFKLVKFGQLCDPFPHPLGPKGFFQLSRKTNEDQKSRSDKMFDCFFNSDQFLLTNEVNSRFQIILETVLRGNNNFWQGEHLFELNVNHIKINESVEPAALFKTLRFTMNHPIDDGEKGLLFANIELSIDIVACVQVEDWWPEDPLPGGISPDVKANGCTFVFDQPRFDTSKKRDVDFIFSDTFARISFAPVESRVIGESTPIAKAAYIVCKTILSNRDIGLSTYQLKTSLLFCTEALTVRNEKVGRDENFSPEELVFWVERIFFSLTEFNRHDVFPCYFMPSFKQPVSQAIRKNCYFMQSFKQQVSHASLNNLIAEKNESISVRFSEVYEIYLHLCPDDTAIDIPIVRDEDDNEILYVNCDPNWEEFDREEFIRKLSSRNSK